VKDAIIDQNNTEAQQFFNMLKSRRKRQTRRRKTASSKTSNGTGDFAGLNDRLTDTINDRTNSPFRAIMQHSHTESDVNLKSATLQPQRTQSQPFTYTINKS